MDTCIDQNLTGTTVTRYAIADLIGSGGMGHVYRARDERLQRNVAIKVVGRPTESRPRLEHNLIGEARALSRLTHPHVAAIYDYLTESGRDFIVMELVPGSTLKDILTVGPLPFDEVLRLGRQMIQGLAAAHAAQIVHCDIKPANIKVTTEGELKILDFGVARLMPMGNASEASTTSNASFVPIGTIPYMPPEQLRGGPADERNDVFSAGAVLYEMATGHPPFARKTMVEVIDAILHQEPAKPSAMNPNVPRAFDRVVAKAMAKDPLKRYSSAGDVDAALARLATARRRPRPPIRANGSHDNSVGRHALARS
jgi:eukaryotic-like serine/threonine-protein kinase